MKFEAVVSVQPAFTYLIVAFNYDALDAQRLQSCCDHEATIKC